jgi:DNA-binding transcriptional LysR family regulator
MDQFKVVATFIQAASLGSFGKAAKQLGISQQQASKNIRQLETHLGVRLFNRTTRQVSLTDAGQLFLADSKEGMDKLAQAFANTQSGNDEAKGTIRMTLPKALAAKVVVPLIAEFRLLYPGISIETLVDDHLTDLVENRIDVGIRAGTIADGRLVARKLVPIQLIVCAAPSYLALHGTPLQIDELANFDCTAYRHLNTGKIVPWEFMLDGQLAYRDVPYAFASNDVEAECEAVVSGMGIGQLASFSAVPYILEKKLIPLFPDLITERFGLYLYYLSREHQPKRVRLFIDFLSKRLKGNEQLYLSPATLAKFGNKRGK